jgi:hypothetical protein
MWTVLLASGALSGVLSGCYQAVEAGDEARPDHEDPQAEDSSSSQPPLAGAPAPADPPPVRPTDPPDTTTNPPDPIEPAPSEPWVTIEGEPSSMFMQNSQIVGDLDGDGFDDLLVFAMWLPNGIVLMTPPESAAYVFYGRSEWPKVISATSADAVLRGAGFATPLPNANSGGATGDFNGDGLADLVIGGVDVAYFIFGSEERLSGEHPIGDVTLSWTFPEAPLPLFRQTVRVAAAGDVQGDGLSDFTVTLTTDEHVTVFPNGTGSSPIDSTYLVAGSTEDWPSGTFEPEWALTAFVVDDSEAGGCTLYATGDLNGDGFTDLVLQAETNRRLVLGGADVITGMVTATEAGEGFELPGGYLRALPDLDGDGSQELAWTDILGSDTLYLSYGDLDLDPAQLVEPDVTVAATAMRVPATAAADFDGDGTKDLMLMARGPADGPFGLYLIATAGLRDQAKIGLENARLVFAVPGVGEATAPFGLALDAGGDVNGDGIDDALLTTVTLDPMPLGKTSLMLLAGGAGPAAP